MAASSIPTEDILAESASLREQKSDAASDVEAIQKQLEELWSDSYMAEYELSSVFMHRGVCLFLFLIAQEAHTHNGEPFSQGAANFGHYWLHQRALPSQPERWLKFNDASVCVVL